MATFYFALAGVWGFGFVAQVVGTITAVDAFLGVLLSVSKAQYNNTGAAFDGSAGLIHDVESGTQSIKVNIDPADLLSKGTLTLKVTPPPALPSVNPPAG